ncbi:GLPGLI family protein, partial [Lutibacter sp.]
TRVTVSGEKQIPVIAWFAPEIPYPFGPAGYLGLPGLVLEVEVSKIIIYASKIFLNHKEKQIIETPKKGKIISEKEYNEFEKNGFSQFKKF